MDNEIVIVEGDTAIETVVESGLLLREATHERQWLLVTSNSKTLAGIDHLAHADPMHVQLIELTKPPATTGEHWNDELSSNAAQLRHRFEQRSRYDQGDRSGSVSRADAHFRTIASGALVAGMERAARRVMIQPMDAQLTVRTLVVASLMRNQGSGGLAATLATLGAVLRHYRHQATIQVDVLVSTYSVNIDEPARTNAKLSRALAFAEVALSEQFSIPAAVTGSIPRELVGHIIECGAPPTGKGMLRDEREARRAFALVLESLLEGGIASVYIANRPQTTSATVEERPKGAIRERLRFSGMGGVEVRLEPDRAAEYLAAHLLANLPDLSAAR